MKIKLVIFMTLAVLLALAFQNCGDVRLRQQDGTAAQSSQFQATIQSLEGTAISSNIRTIFVVDTSGSNAFPSPPSVVPTVPPSDLNRTRRFSPIRDFVMNSKGPADRMFWSLLKFNTSVGYLPPNKPITNNASDFLRDSVQAALDDIALDSGNTNYLAALEQVIQSIKATAQSEANLATPESSTYQIFFVSDGAPGERNLAGVFIPQELSRIEEKARELMNLRLSYRTSIDGIQLHTGLYFGGNSPEPGAQTALERMSVIGEGRFLVFAPGQNLDFSNFSGLTRTIQFEYRDLWVMNRNAVWEQFALKQDTDGDGLSDQLEVTMGSSPQNADSDFNGASDAVERKIFGSPCAGVACAQATHRVFPQCIGKIPFPDSDGDLLNDCEERLLGSQPNLFDSGSQGLPDSIAFRNGLSLTNGGALYLDPDADRVTTYMEIKKGLPPLTPNSQLLPAPLIDVGVSLLGTSSGFSEYRLDFRQLPYLRPDDQMILFWIEETPNIVSRRILRTFEIHKNGYLTEMGGKK